MLSLRGGSLVAFRELQAGIVEGGFEGAVVVEPSDGIGGGRVPVGEGAEVLACVVVVVIG